MASSVYYKFKSQRNESRVTFDGTGISVFDLKKEIILQNNLKAQDIDLLLFDSAEQEFKDDSFIISRSTSVIAKRLPAIRPGRGKAAIYVAGISGDATSQPLPSTSSNVRANASGPSSGAFTRFSGNMTKRFDGREDKLRSSVAPSVPASGYRTGSEPQGNTSTPPAGDDEAGAIAAMFAATSEQWEETQEQMAHVKPIYHNRQQNGPRKPFNGAQQHIPDSRPVPPGYICHRCAKKGHWIHDCPTNDDREYDNRPRIKRTTGIPRSFLQSVEVPSGATPLSGIMITPEGGFVRAQPDSATWQKHLLRSKALTEAEIREKPPTDSALACTYPDCGKLFRRAVKTPCCSTPYCEECIQTHLLEKDFQCPNCKAKIASLDRLVPDKEMRERVRKYIDNAIEESKQDEEQPKEIEHPTKKPEDVPVSSQEEEYTDFQPGNDGQDAQQQQYNGYNEQFDPQQTITQLQAQLAQLMLMMQNPTLPLTSRMQFQMQIQNLTAQLRQAEMIAAQASFGGMNGMNMGMGMMNGGMGGGVGMMGGGGPIPGLGMLPPDGMNGMGGGYGMQPQHQPQWNAQPKWNGGYAMQQQQQPQQHQPQHLQQQHLPIDESAYQRLPMNNRRKNLKRERPADFVEVGSEQKRLYWE